LKEFLFERKILCDSTEKKDENKTSLEFFCDALNRRIDKQKKYHFFEILKNYSAILIIGITPIWAAFNSWMYMKNNPYFQDGITYFVEILFIVSIVIFLGILLKDFFLDDIFRFEDQRISELIEMLGCLRFSISNPEYLEQFKFEEMDNIIAIMIGKYNSIGITEVNILGNTSVVMSEKEK